MITDNVEQYELWLDICKKKNRSILIEEKGSRKSFVSGIGKNKISCQYIPTIDENKKYKNLWIYSQVARSFKLYWENNEPEIIVPTLIKTTYVDRSNVNSLNLYQKFYAIDINHCYWRMALKLGYILQETYEKGLEKCSKVDLLAALGSVKRDKTFTKLKGEKIIKRGLEDNKNTIGKLYDNIIYQTNLIIKEVHKIAGNSFLKYNVDCIYFTDESKIEEIGNYINSIGFQYKLIECFKMNGQYYFERGKNRELKKF